MTPFKITLATKDPGSALTGFVLAQLQTIEWIDCKVSPFDDLRQARESDFFVTVLEGTSFRDITEVCAFYRKNNKNAIYLSVWNGQLMLGPTHFPGKTAGADSCFLVLQQEQAMTGKKQELKDFATARVTNEQLQQSSDVFYTAFAELLNEVKIVSLDKPGQQLKLVDNVALYNLVQKDKVKSESKYIYPVFEGGGTIGDDGSLMDYKILLSKYLHSVTQIKRNFFDAGPEPEHREDQYNNIAIVGGGTAGYLTALLMKATYPDMRVTLIESSKVPVIGVGEATTPEIRRFMFETLKFPPHEFYEAVKPTWKLGIRFFWGLPGDYYFNYPFGVPDVRSAYLTEGHINNSSLTATLMDRESSFVVSTPDQKGADQYSTLSDDLFYALHLDNVQYISYLKIKAKQAGIIYIDDLIVDAERKDNSEEISAVIGEHGTRHEYDFYVDCTGFRSMLLEKLLGSPYHSYSNSLFTDTAVTGCIKNVDRTKTYTYAESMHHGWCWNTPMRGEDHRGYVFSSAHCSADQAMAEMEARNPGIKPVGVVKFKAGRHREICIGNVFAIGNSFAFVEPLESTGIHMIIKEAKSLVYHFPQLKRSPTLRKRINTEMNEHWDYLRDFLAIHYKFNKKYDTPFWKDCRELTDVSDVQWMIDLYYETGLLSHADKSLMRLINSSIKDDIFGLHGFDVMMMGQGELPNNFDRNMRNKHVWESNVKTWKSIRSMTVPVDKDLDILTEYLESKW
ncbi:MAG: tryptophan halogenase family protein [Chitinophagaceae bacterium]